VHQRQRQLIHRGHDGSRLWLLSPLPHTTSNWLCLNSHVGQCQGQPYAHRRASSAI
jgi:hypothetical protein